MFEYMAAGIPIIASNFPAWAKVIEKHHCGISVDPTNPKAIADAITYLYEHPDEARQMGERGRSAVINEFNWDNEKVKLEDLYSHVLNCN